MSFCSSRSFALALLGMLVLATWGCVTMPHPPQSEALMLRHMAPTPKYLWEEASGGMFLAPYHGLARIAALVQDRELDGQGDWEDYFPELPGYFITGFNSEGTFAMSLSLRTSFGADATVRIAPEQYITLASTIYRLTRLRQIRQAYYQVRVVETPHSGLGLGVGYREDLFTYSVYRNELPFFAIRHHTVGSVGGRAQLVLHSGGRHRLGIRLSGYLGRALTLDQTVWSLMLSAGRF
ncbi:MAG: hypothetical protein AAGJ10_04820 [Bacteroidota bacterium]